jgi:hypothetical protein
VTGERDDRAPIGFRLIVGAAAVYLLIRLVQAVAWVVDRLR